ncbi:LAME_0F17700g1_1 [Lachancea meyersii CBS 8951]|uniref:LAME_0F17700g1_1 n=1 Tax=Lachancea meyersii CBS 8951 TaxID=1266667 RepID=A0A1G4K028_9SACH|nr:LAME_0F17700g1_1 [Lachancea meyersii CBS 8951]
MNSLHLKIELKRYSSYQEYMPAPEGFNSAKLPTSVNKWRHYPSTASIALVVYELHSTTGMFQLVVDGAVVEQIAFYTDWKVRGLGGQIAQFSARYPAILCKYMVNLQGSLFMKRFQMGFNNVMDFENCCQTMRTQGFPVKVAPVLGPTQFSQVISDVFSNSQYTFDKPYSTPPDSQIVDTRGPNTHTYRVVADMVNSTDALQQIGPMHNISQPIVELDTQSFSQATGDSIGPEFTQSSGSIPKNGQDGNSRPAAMNGPEKGRADFFQVAQSRISIQKLNATDINCTTGSQPCWNHVKAYQKTSQELDKVVPFVKELLQSKGSTKIPVHSTFKKHARLGTTHDSGDKSCIPALKLDEALTKTCKSAPIVNDKPIHSGEPIFKESSTDTILAHPLQGLRKNQRVEVGEKSGCSNETILNESRAAITPDVIKQKLNDVAFRNWVCGDSTEQHSFSTHTNCLIGGRYRKDANIANKSMSLRFNHLATKPGWRHFY